MAAREAIPAASGPPNLAVLVRGLVWKKQSGESHWAKHRSASAYTHDALRAAFPSIMSHIIAPAERCGFRVRVLIGTYNATSAQAAAELDRRVKRMKPAHVFWYNPNLVLTQFGLAQSLLVDFFAREQRDMQSNDIVLLTRDDFVYSAHTWSAIASRYDPMQFNVAWIVGCQSGMPFYWDGLHVFPFVQTPVFATAFRADVGVGPRTACIRGKRAARCENAHMLRHAALSLNSTLIWIDGIYGNPNPHVPTHCKQPLGYLDRGPGNASTSAVGSPAAAHAAADSTCCTTDWATNVGRAISLPESPSPRRSGPSEPSGARRHGCTHEICEPEAAQGWCPSSL